METNAQRHENNPEFLEFLSRKFDKIAVDATIEELAEFAFGSLEKAIEEFEKYKKD
jgi:hypothetical protein